MPETYFFDEIYYRKISANRYARRSDLDRGDREFFSRSQFNQMGNPATQYYWADRHSVGALYSCRFLAHSFQYNSDYHFGRATTCIKREAFLVINHWSNIVHRYLRMLILAQLLSCWRERIGFRLFRHLDGASFH